jgi:NADH:ubiquinone oxidoreductase subunit K
MMETLALYAPDMRQWLLLSAVWFSIGLYGLLTRRNAVAILMSAELMLNAAALNFIVFNRFLNIHVLDGQVMAFFVIAVAAAEVVVGMAIFVAIARYRRTVDVTQMSKMQH